MDNVENDSQIFQVRLDNGEVKDAELLNVVEIEGKKYAIYSIDNGDETVDILASYLVKDEEGYDKLVDIESDEDRAKVAEVIKELTA
ncbi:MAG TPA: DUF1292 domain-containing protein [Bacilli bacterium]|nr:DUF1292 domain-containing protein [Bacilli bacterium]